MGVEFLAERGCGQPHRKCVEQNDREDLWGGICSSPEWSVEQRPVSMQIGCVLCEFCAVSNESMDCRDCRGEVVP